MTLYYDMSGNLGYEDYQERWELLVPKNGEIKYIEPPSYTRRVKLVNTKEHDGSYEVEYPFLY